MLPERRRPAWGRRLSPNPATEIGAEQRCALVHDKRA